MDIKQLEYFITVVNEGNITAASKKLLIAQPALSNQIKKLEEELDVKLFHRGARKIALTDSGQIVFAKAMSMLELKKSLKNEIEDSKNGIHGTLKIGTISAIDTNLLEENFLNFNKKYNKIKYELYEGITPEIIKLLQDRTIEIGIVRTPFDTTGLRTIYKNAEPMIAAYSDDEELDKLGGEVNIEDLKNKPLIIYRRFEDIVISAFQRHEVNPHIICINDDSRTSLLWANTGLGIAIVPLSSKDLVLANNLKFKIIKSKYLYTQIVIITLEYSCLSKIGENFLKEMIKVEERNNIKDSKIETDIEVQNIKIK